MMTALLLYLIIPGLLGFPILATCTPTQQHTQHPCKCRLEHHSNLTPFRQTGTNITLWASFTTERILQHQQDVYWIYPISPSAIFPGNLDLVDKSQLLYNASLTIFLNVTTDGNTYFGHYELLVCNRTLETFNVRKEDPCAIQEQLLVSINTSAVIPILNNENVSLLCIAHAYYGTLVNWDGPSCSRDKCIPGISNYYIDSNCTFYSTMTIINPTTDDSGLYSCIISEQSSLATNITIFKLPYTILDTPISPQYNQADPLDVNFTIHGVVDYVEPVAAIIMNSKNVKTPCNSTRCRIIVKRVPSQKRTLVTFSADAGWLPTGNYTFQVCIKLNNNVSSSYAERYNQNPNCTTNHVNIVYKDEFLTIIIASSVCGVLLLLVTTTIILAVSRHRHRRHPRYERIATCSPPEEEIIDRDSRSRPGYEANSGSRPGYEAKSGSCKNIFILNDASTDKETRDLCDILNGFSVKSDGNSKAFKCHCIQDKEEPVDNFSNWVVIEIKSSAIVLLVCSEKMHKCLTQVRGRNNLDVTTGVICGTTIFNAITQAIGKFSLVSLNRAADSRLVPTILAERKHYAINTDKVRELERPCTDQDELQAEMDKYMDSEAGKDFRSLLEYLHK